MKKYLFGLLIATLLINGCGGSSGECDYKIGKQCVTEDEKDIFDILSEKVYYSHSEISGNVGQYLELRFSEESLTVSYPAGSAASTTKYGWGIKGDEVLIDFGERNPLRYNIEKNANSILIYSIVDDQECYIWDTKQMAAENDFCLTQ